MKIISFNANSIRMRTHQLEAIIKKHNPDFIGIQETKVTDIDFPVSTIKDMGYHVEFCGQKTHYGVALMSKHPFVKTCKSFPSEAEDAQKRFVMGEFNLPFANEEAKNKKIAVLNGYFPQGESNEHPTKYPNKQEYYANLQTFLNENYTPQDNVIVMGDVNVSHRDADIGIGEDNRKRWLRTGKCSFLPEERQWLDTLLEWGLTDTYRKHVVDAETEYSWFDYRSKGFEREPKRGLRIDLIMSTPALTQACIGAGIDYDIRAMEKPSDHCPIWAEFDLKNC